VSSLTGRVALVTGASRGIGAATCELLDSAGARVLRVARTLPPDDRRRYHDLPCDLSQSHQVEALPERVLREGGAPDIVVHSAGGFLLRPLEDTSVEDFDAQMAINLRAAFCLARGFLPRMRSAGAGRFIAVGSVADHVGFPENSAYAASKYGLRGLHETLLAEYRGTGVGLTLISPGPTDTALWDAFDPDNREGFPSRGEMLRPLDVAEAILFVATRPAHVVIDWLRLGPA
jgi:NAD(P)-dependent dehydrogenase (short-subunit alcohol dehydrogenase family)